MINSISSIGIKPIPSVPGSSDIAKTDGKLDFGKILSESIDKVNQMQSDATQVSNDFIAGKIDDLHTVMIEGQKADLALQFTLQVRNKILDAYSEIMRMQL
jgi:flagellar hook-basal body complex protein FliE